MAAGAAGACPGYRDGPLIPVIQISGSGESKASSPRPVCQPASPRSPLHGACELPVVKSSRA